MPVVSPATRKKWQKVEHNAIQTKSGGPFEEFLSLTCRPLAPGRYRIQWQGEAARNAGTTSLPKLRCNVDGVQVGIMTFGGAVDQEYQSWSGWDFQQFNEGDTPVINIEGRRYGGGSDTINFRRLKISIELMER